MTKSTLARTPNNEIQLTITIPTDQVKTVYDEVVVKVAKEAKVNGFRQGKAPVNLVEEKIDKNKIYEQVLQDIVPQAYLDAVKEHNIVPIIRPHVELLKAEEGEAWEIRAITCEKPKVDLGNYTEVVKTGLAPNKLWIPGKKDKEERDKSKEDDHDEKVQKVIQALLGAIYIDLPPVLVEEELNRALAGLINQTEKLGLTIDQYLTSISKTVKQVREEYRIKVTNDIKLEFILDAVTNDRKIEVGEKEIQELVNATGDEKLKKDLASPENQIYLKTIISRRKVLDFLAVL
ncbi:MAG: trigger factor [bacterium]|nr:trigger factor [bacterium]